MPGFIGADAEEADPTSTKTMRAPRRPVAWVELRERIYVWLRLFEAALPALLPISALLALSCTSAH